MADKLTPQDIDYILGRSNPEPVKRPSKSQPFQDLKKLSPIVPSGLAGLAGVAADLGASFVQGAKRLPAMWDQQTAYNDYKIAEKYGLDPSEALAGLLAAKMRMDQIPSVDGTEKVNQLFTDEGDGFMQELPGALANTPNFIAEQLPTSILGHPRQLAGQIGGGLAGAAIGMPIAGSAAGGTILGGPEYGAEIMGDALERGQYPGAEKIGMDGIDPVKQAIASYGSSALDSAGEGLELLGKTGADNLIADLLIRTGRGAAIEAPTEAAQQALQIFGSGGDVTTKESIDEIKQAAGAGGIMGGGLGALGTVTGERKKKEEGKDTPDDPRAWVAAPEPKIPPSTGPAGLPGYIDADALREKVEPKAPTETPGAAPEVSPTEGIETSGVEAPKERIGDDIKDDIAYAQRFADAATDEPDIITPDAIGQAPEGVTRSFERVPVFERQRLSLEDAQRTVETEIAARRDQGMSFREALDDYLESPIKKQLDELVNPSWHQTPMADDDAPVGFGVRVIDTLPDGTQQSVVVSPKGKPLDEKSYEEFVKGLQPPPIEAPKQTKPKPEAPIPNDAGFYSRAKQVFDASPRQVGNGKKWAEVFTGAGVKESDIPHILPGLEKNKQYSRDDIAKMLEQRRGVEVNRLRYESLDDPESGASGFKDDTRYEDYSISKIVPGAKDYGETLVKLTGEGPGQNYTNLHFPGEEGLVGHVRHFKMPDGSFVVEENQSFLHQAQRNLEEANDIAVTEDDVNTAKETLIEARDSFELSVDQALNEIDTLKEMIEEASAEFEEGNITDFLDELEFKLEEVQSVSNVTRPQRGFETDQEYEDMQSSALEQAHEDGDNLIQLFNEGIESIFNEGDGVPQVLKDLEDQVYKVGRALEELSIDDVRSAELSVIEAEGALLDAQDSISDAKGAPLANDYTERMIQTALMQAVRDPEATGFYHVGPDVRNGNIEFGNDISKGMKLHYETIRDQELARIAKQFGLKTKDKKIKIDENEYRNRLRNYKDQLKEAVNLELRKPVEQQNQKAIEEVGAELERVGKILNSDEDRINPEITVRGFDLTPEQKAKIARSGFPLLKPDNNNRDLRSQFSPAEKEWLADELRKMLDGMKFPNVGIAILDSLGDAMGQYNFSTETIELAMDTMSGDTPAATLKAARGLLNHEIVHAFLAMNIIDEASWARIKDEIKNKPITAAQIKKLGYGADVVPGMTWLEAVLAEYPDYSSEYYFGYAEELAAETGMSFEEALETAQIEEAVAEFSRLQGINNDAVPAFIRPLVSGLADAWRRVLNAVRNFFNKAGPKRTSELKEFVRALHSGELGPGGEREIAGEMDYEYDPETDDFKPAMALSGLKNPRGDGRGSEPFYDERLSPSQNKAVEMARNNYPTAEIAEELDTSYGTAQALLSQARKKIGADMVPSTAERGDKIYSEVYRLHKKGLSNEQVAQRLSTIFGKDISKTSVAVQISKLRSEGLLPEVGRAKHQPWSKEEIAEFQRLRAQGLSFAEIGKALGRTRAQVSGLNYRSNGNTFNPKMALGDGKLRGRLEVDDTEYFGPKKSEIDPAGFFSALQNAWEAAKNRPNVPDRLPVYKWIQRLQAARIPDRPKMEEIRWFFRDVPFDATLSKASIDKIMSDNRLSLNVIDSSYNPITDTGFDPDEKIRTTNVRLPAAEGADQTAFERVLQLPKGVPGSDYQYSHQNRAPIFVEGAYVSALGETRPVQMRDGTVIENADFAHQVQADIVQKQQTETLPGLDQEIAQLEASEKSYRESGLPMPPAFQKKLLDARATRRLIKNPPPLNSTEQFTKIGVWTAMFQAATNGRDAIAFPFGETADRIQGGGGDNHSKVGGRAKFYTTQVRNTVYRIANRLGATVELGYVTYTAKDQKQAATPELKSIVNSLNPESPALQNLAGQMKQLVAMPEMTRGDLTMLLANYSMTAGMLGQEAPEIDSILSNIDRLIAPAQSNQRRAPVYIMRLNPQMRAKILRSGMPLFAAKGSRYNPKGKHVPKTVSNPVGSDYIPVIPGTLQDLDEITSQMSYKQVAPKMLRKPFVGGIVDYLDKSLQFALKGMWKKTGPLASLYQYWGPMGNMKDQDIFVGLLMKAQGRVAQSAAITKLAQTLSSNEAEHENVMDYMMTKSGVVSYSRQNPDGSWTQYVDNSEALALQRIKDPKVREAAKSAKQVMIDLGHLLVQHNLISEKQRKSHEGTYLPRMFMKYLNSYIVPTGPRMSGVGYNYGRKGKMVRQQGDPTEQGLMDPNNPNPQAGVEWTQVGPTAEDDIIAGQIKDPGILVAHAVQVGVRDVAVQNFLAAILEHGAKTNNGWVLPNTTVKYDGKIMNLWTLSQEKELIDQMLIEKMAQDARLGVTSYDSFILQQESSFIDALLNRTPEWNKVYQAGELPNGYKMIPKNKWVYDGAAGAIVKDEIFHYLKSTANGLGLEDGTAAAEVARVGGKALNVFKMAKTVFSPASQMRQHVSNALALPLYGINMVRWGQALGAIVEHYSGKPNKYVKVAIENGQTTQSFTQAELRQVGELHRKLMSKRGENSAIRKVPVIGDLYHIYHSTNEWISWIKKTADTVNEVGARASNAAGTFYQLADSIAKVAVIIDEMDRGIPPILAAEKAREYFGDYSHVRPWVRFLRSAPGIAPFITYSYIMLPNMIKAFATAPWRFAPIYAFYVFMAAMATAELGGDDEDQEKAMKEALNILDDDTKIKEVTKLERILDDPEVNQLAKDRAQKRLDKIREDSSLLTAYRMTQPDYVRDDPYLFMNLLAPRDKYGRLQMTTLKPIIPFGQFADTWPGLRDGRMLDALGSIGVNGGPLFSNASVWATGIEPGLEREIWNKYDPQEVKNAKSLAYTLSSITSPEMSRFSPPGAVTPGLSLIPGYAAVEPGQGWSTFAGNGVNKYGNPNLTPEQLAIREMGFNIMPGDVNLGHEIRLKGYDRKIQEANTDINTIYKDQTLINEDGELSKIGQDRVKLYEEQLKNLIKERSDYINRVSEILALEAENEFAKPEE